MSFNNTGCTLYMKKGDDCIIDSWAIKEKSVTVCITGSICHDPI